MSDITEVWKPVVEQEGRYEVSSLGRIRTVARIGTRKDGSRLPVAERIRVLTIDKTGYALIGLSTPAGSRTKFVHRVVLEAFVGPRPEGMECRHLDGNPLNNRIENICWGTPSDNAWDRVAHGTHFHGSKTHCKRGHELSPENTYTSPSNRRKQRDCRECRLYRQRRNKGKVA